MKVSVAICTHDRASLLDGCLAALAGQTIPPGTEWELVVVANACTDGTEDVIRRHAAALPLRPIREPRLGVSHARNRVLDEARGDLVLFTDDDVRPEPGWLAAHAAAAESFPDAAFLGGPVDPEYAVPPPRWVTENPDVFEGILALRPRASWPHETTPIRAARDLPCGANFGFRPDRTGDRRFDGRLGRRGENPGALEETEFLRSLLDDGETGVWVPEAAARHVVRPDRLQFAYLSAWYRAYGRTSAGLRPERVPGRTRLRLRLALLRFVGAVGLRRGGARWVRARRRAAKAEGMLQWRAARRRPPASE